MDEDPEPPNLNKIFKRLRVSLDNQRSLIGYMDLLENHTKTHFYHSYRVGLFATNLGYFIEKTGMYEGLGPKPLFYSGLLHDIGKMRVDKDILEKKWDSRDQYIDVLKKHPLESYKILMGDHEGLNHPDIKVHAFSSISGLLHHEDQDDPYPLVLPKLEVKFSPNTIEKAIECSRLVALVDSYDAGVYRHKKMDHQEAIESLMDKARPKEKDLLRLIQLSNEPVFSLSN